MNPLLRESLRERLVRIYGSRQEYLEREIAALVRRYTTLLDGESRTSVDMRDALSERDVAMIAYGDQIRAPDQPPLAALHRFLTDEQWHDFINTLHILPFFPSSSDDGFAVVDYLQVDPALGNWQNIERLRRDFRLMFDLVLNHVSQQHKWFQKYLSGEEPYSRFFIDLDGATDVSQVTRPRSHPLLTPFESAGGTRYVWTTFSADQVDLNYAEPQLLLRMLRVMLEYIRRGARIIRLDAVAYLWKDPGSSSIHLSQTHEVVKLMRNVAEAVAPGVLLLTETNVPHWENIRYFGDGDEAHLVYQFSLPPLLLDAYLNRDGTVFSQWLAGLFAPPPGAAYFNFTASHDGVGLRPLEGLVSEERIARLIEHVRQCGGLVSTRRTPDGAEKPYELNLTYVDALSPPEGMQHVELHARRFLASQGIMLALAGMPAVYFHSLVGTQNDHEGVQTSGRARRINRRKFEYSELKKRLAEEGTLQSRIYRGYRQLLKTRVRQPAFHPAAPQRPIDLGDPALIAFSRTSVDQQQRVVVVANLTGEEKRLELSHSGLAAGASDLLGHLMFDDGENAVLPPYEIAWLAADQLSARM